MRVSEEMNKATKISEIVQTCRYYPLDNDNLAKFYIDTSKARGVDVLGRLKNVFELIPNIHQQVLFLGHIGAGKSTLLYQLEKSLENEYKVIRFSVQQLLDTETITFADLLCVMYERILNSCGSSIEHKKDKLEEIYNSWHQTVIKESENIIEGNLTVTGEAGIGFKTKLVNLFAKLTSAIKVGAKNRTIIRETIENDILDYIHMLNELIQIINDSESKPLLLMFEDLEKIPKKNAEDIFINKASYFHNIKLHMLLTTPISLKYLPGFKNTISQNFAMTERCPIIAVTNSDRTPSPEGIETLKEIVHARVAEELIEENALNSIILNSGGILRDLLGMIHEAARKCSGDIITQEDADFAFTKLQEDYGDGLRENQIELIKKVYENPFGVIFDDAELDLMRYEVIIEYNGKQWRGVHPAVVQYLQDRGLLPVKK